jgi:hypothetical protein
MAQPPQVEVLGYDTRFQLGNTNDFNTSTTWTDVFAELEDVEPPEQDNGEIKSKHMQSPGMVDENVGGWTDPGMAKATAHYNYTEYAALKAMGRAQQAWRIVFNDPGDPGTGTNRSGILFNGWIKKLGRKPPIDGLVTGSVEIRVTGQTSDIDTISGIT